MSYKNLVLFDESKQKEVYKKTDIRFVNSFTGEEIFRTTNKVIIAGAAFTARSHFDLTTPEVTPTYNEVLDLENSVEEDPTSLERCFLFAAGTGGCGRENSQVYVENYAKWIQPDDLIPFKYQLKHNDLTDDQRLKYFGRKDVGSRYAYYFKAFEAKPRLVQQYIDGTVVTGTIYDDSKTMEVETYVEILLKITKQDFRDFFIATTGINDAKVNSISLLTAWAKTIDGKVYYQNIRPLTQLNIPNEALIDLDKGIDIIYHIYY